MDYGIAIREMVSQEDTVDDQQPVAERLVLSAVSESGRDNSSAIVIEAVG